MKSLASVLLASALLLGCQNESKMDGSGLEARVKKLEEQNAKYADALEFLQKVYAQQKQQMAQQEREEPAPDAVFAVDISANVQHNMVDGPKTGANVTLVEAFDFA